jgi:hypothetical protein
MAALPMLAYTRRGLFRQRRSELWSTCNSDRMKTDARSRMTHALALFERRRFWIVAAIVVIEVTLESLVYPDGDPLPARVVFAILLITSIWLPIVARGLQSFKRGLRGEQK